MTMATLTEPEHDHCEIDPAQPVLPGIDWAEVR